MLLPARTHESYYTPLPYVKSRTAGAWESRGMAQQAGAGRLWRPTPVLFPR